MKPATPVIVFTVASGAGLGLVVWLVLGHWLHEALAPTQFLAGAAVAAALLTTGLLSSTRHLANPRNAWRAFARFRSSWLSREGVFALLVYPFAGVHLLAFVQSRPLLGYVSGVSLVALAVAALASTSMIYACLKTVPRWRNWQTIVAYPLFGLASGGVLWLAVRGYDAGRAGGAALFPFDGATALVIALLAISAALKLHYWSRFAPDDVPDAGRALGLPGRVRLLDAGHAHPTFVTDEFGYVLSQDRARLLRACSLALGFAVPVALLLAPGAMLLAQGALRLPAGGVALPAAACCLAGLLVERWLFFAEARHVVLAYQGRTRGT